MKLDPVSLSCFVSTIEEGTIARAAAREHIVPSAISKRIAELEDVLQSKLLTRTNKGVEPTTAGLALANLARGLLHDIDAVYAQMRDYASGTRGHVRVVANISAITQFLPRDIRSFLAEYPYVAIQLEERTSGTIARTVVENAADVGVFVEGPHAAGIETFPFHSDELVVITPSQHPLARRRSVTFVDTLGFDYVGLHTGSAINALLVERASAANMTLRLRIQVTSYSALCLMVEAGLGIGILPALSARPYVDTLRIREIPLNEPWRRRQLVVGVRSYASLSIAAKLFVDHLLRRRGDGDARRP